MGLVLLRRPRGKKRPRYTHLMGMICIREEGPRHAVLQQATDKQPTPKSKKTTRRQPARQAQGRAPLRVLPSTRAARAKASSAPPPAPSTAQSATTAPQRTAPEVSPAA